MSDRHKLCQSCAAAAASRIAIVSTPADQARRRLRARLVGERAADRLGLRLAGDEVDEQPRRGEHRRRHASPARRTAPAQPRRRPRAALARRAPARPGRATPCGRPAPIPFSARSSVTPSSSSVVERGRLLGAELAADAVHLGRRGQPVEQRAPARAGSSSARRRAAPRARRRTRRARRPVRQQLGRRSYAAPAVASARERDLRARRGEVGRASLPPAAPAPRRCGSRRR